MKKMKKFAAGGRYVMNGDSGTYVEDAPVEDAPVEDAPVEDVPVAAGLGAILSEPAVSGGLSDVRLGPISGGVMPPSGIRQNLEPVERMLPPMLRNQDVSRPMSAGMAGMKKGGAVKKKSKGGTVSSASKRGDGCAIKGKTKGRFV